MTSHIRQHAAMKQKPARETLAANLRQRMDDHDTLNTQAKLAARAGIAQRTVGRMLKNEADPQLGHCEAVAEALGVSLIDLLSDPNLAVSGLHYDSDAVARLTQESREKIESYIRFIIATEGPSGRRNELNVSRTLPATDAQADTVKRVARRSLSDKTLSIHEDQSHTRGGKRGHR
ncbi:helix-turn-helix transcriptional regulator [Burkholderia thailandensis]|nr:helix-turn-helix transcriptional regulator [Burkholderia thailandensis]